MRYCSSFSCWELAHLGPWSILTTKWFADTTSFCNFFRNLYRLETAHSSILLIIRNIVTGLFLFTSLRFPCLWRTGKWSYFPKTCKRGEAIDRLNIAVILDSINGATFFIKRPLKRWRQDSFILIEFIKFFFCIFFW